MGKAVSLAVAVIMSMMFAVPSFVNNISPVKPVDPDEAVTPTEPVAPADTTGTDENTPILPVDLYENTIFSTNGRFETNKFTVIPEYGNYIRYWFDNYTDHNINAYLYRVDSGKNEIISTMTIEANSSQAQVYYSPDAGSGTYKIVIETFYSTISGDVLVTQSLTYPE